MLPNVIQSKLLNGIYLKEVTKIHTICDFFNENPNLEELLLEVHMLLKIYSTILVTTLTVKRSFSALNKDKDFKEDKDIPSKFNDRRTS